MQRGKEWFSQNNVSLVFIYIQYNIFNKIQYQMLRFVSWNLKAGFICISAALNINLTLNIEAKYGWFNTLRATFSRYTNICEVISS